MEYAVVRDPTVTMLNEDRLDVGVNIAHTVTVFLLFYQEVDIVFSINIHG